MGGWPAVALVIFLMFFGVIPPDTAQAAPDKTVEIKAEMGWQGQGVPGRYAPAVLQLKNTGGKDITGLVEAINYHKFQFPPAPGSPTNKGQTSFYPSAAFGEMVTLPASSEKKIIIWFPLNGAGGRTDFVFRTEGKELARVSKSLPNNLTYPNGPLPGGVGVMGKVPPALEKVRVVMPDGVVRYIKALQLTGELFPRRGEELNAFSTILVTGQGAAELNAEQRKALAQWVKNGGSLVLSGGMEIDNSLSVLPQNMISITVDQITERSEWQSAAAWLNRNAPGSVNAAMAPLSGSGEPWGPQDDPLGLRCPLGDGEVVVMGFDPNQPPWQAGALGEGLWQNFLVAPETEKYGYKDPYYGEQRLGSLVHMTNNLPAEAFPGWRPVAMFLLAFLIIAGPVTYWLLRRIRHPEYTWMVVPILSVLFAGAVYIYMLQTSGNVLVNVVQVVDSRESGEPVGYTAVGYFAPTRSNFTAVLENPDQAVQVQPMGGRSPELMREQDEPPYSVIRGSDLKVRFSDTSQWSTRGMAFQNQNLAQTIQGLEAEIQVQGNKITAQVINKTDMHLDHVVLFMGTGYKVLGDMEPGQDMVAEMEVNVPKYDSKNNYRTEYPTAWQVFMYPDGPPAPAKPGMPPPSTNRRLSASEQRKANLMENWMNSIRRYGRMEAGLPLTVLAWSDSPAADLGIKEIYRPPHYLTMFIMRPEIKLPTGPFTIPAGLVNPEIWDSQVRGMFGHNNLMGLDGGSVTFAFKPYLPAQTQIKDIKLHLDYFSTTGSKKGMGPPAAQPGAVPAGVLEVYHPGRGDWEQISGSDTFSLSGDFATRDGEVKVRILGGEPDNGTGFYFLPPTVAYGGEKV